MCIDLTTIIMNISKPKIMLFLTLLIIIKIKFIYFIITNDKLKRINN